MSDLHLFRKVFDLSSWARPESIIESFIEGYRLSRSRMIWLLAHPLSSPLPSVSSTGDTQHRKTEKERLVTDGRGGEGGGRGA